MKKSVARVFWDSLTVGEKHIYIKIHVESRRGMRMSFGKEYINLRIPGFLSTIRMKEAVEKCKKWVLAQIQSNPDLINRYHTRDYSARPILTVMGENHTVTIKEALSEKSFARIQDSKIEVCLPTDVEGYTRSKMIRTLLSRILAKAYKRKIIDRVQYFNGKYLQKEVNNVYLKYNTSNWGSCSTNNNINLSTRTLLTPVWVIDYVIVHELCHLVEMNHSAKFWNLVSKIYPNYKQAEVWLKQNGSQCYF